LDQRLLLERVLVRVGGPLAPVGDLLLLRQDEDVLLLLRDLLDRHLLAFGLDAEVDGGGAADGQEDGDEDRDRAEAAALEVAVVAKAGPGGGGGACGEVVVVGGELREEHARGELFPSSLGRCLVTIEHDPSCARGATLPSLRWPVTISGAGIERGP